MILILFIVKCMSLVTGKCIYCTYVGYPEPWPYLRGDGEHDDHSYREQVHREGEGAGHLLQGQTCLSSGSSHRKLGVNIGY